MAEKKKSTKVAKKKIRKKRKKKVVKTDLLGRKLPADVPQLGLALKEQRAIIRKTSATDYITDTEGHAVRWHYEREDRVYAKVVKFGVFLHWSEIDKWSPRRDEFWTEVEERVRAHMGAERLKFRIKHLAKLGEMATLFENLLKPLQDKDGNPLLDDEGMQRFAAELPKLDKLADMYLKLTERSLVLRGEVTKRSETVNEAAPITAHTKTPTLRARATDVKAMARHLLRERVPELAEEDEDEDLLGSDHILAEEGGADAEGSDVEVGSPSDAGT